MARVLHLLPREAAALAVTVMRRDVEAGDEVAVAVVGEAAAPPLPPGVAVHRVPSDWSYDQLLERIFGADRVITW
jgi:hypothetical protein